MKAQILSAKKYNKKLKVTIQSSGKLGFTDETAKAFNLSEKASFIKFILDEENPDDLYLSLSTTYDEDAFKVCKAGDYFYLPTTLLFNEMGYNYKEYTIIFDLSRYSQYDEEFGGEVYRMFKREKSKKEVSMK